MKLIDADAILKKLQKLKAGMALTRDNDKTISKQIKTYLLFQMIGIDFAIDEIRNAPIIEKRQKGEWKMPYETTTMVSRCSLCGSYGQRTLNFCPNCGADMREDKR